MAVSFLLSDIDFIHTNQIESVLETKLYRSRYSCPYDTRVHVLCSVCSRNWTISITWLAAILTVTVKLHNFQI